MGLSEIKVSCNGCHRKIKAKILKSYYITSKNYGRPSDPEYPYFLKLRISRHRRGLLKDYCNRSYKVFTKKHGTYQKF